jgi:SHS2 domain-containing protein
VRDSAETWGVPGVRAIGHTADVAIEIDGARPETVFDRAALGLYGLVFGRAPSASRAVQVRPFSATGPDYAMLLRAWLRHLLELYDDEGLGYVSAEFDRLIPSEVKARVGCAPVAHEPIREIKGVTLHELRMAPHDGGWKARVVFDV